MTNQQKHQRIYELTGIEPKYWRTDLEGCEEVRSPTRSMKFYEDVISLSKPDYPAEQLWEIADSAGSKYDYCHKEYEELWFGHDILNYEETEVVQRHRLHSIDLTEIGILTALPDMVLWAIENGYIKKNERSEEWKSDARSLYDIGIGLIGDEYDN